MTDANFHAADTPAAASTFAGQALSLPGWTSPGEDRLVERERLMGQARGTDAARQLQRCFRRWMKAFDHLAWRARAPGRQRAVDPNDPDIWESRDEQAQAVLRRHGLTNLKAGRLTLAAVTALVDGQRATDHDAGLDWGTLTVPASRLDEPLRRAHARLPIDLSDPTVYIHRDDQRRVLAGRLGLAAGARLPGRVRPRRPPVLANRVDHMARARRRAARDDRAGAAAGGPVRRTGDQNGRLAAEPGAVTRRDPSGRDARRQVDRDLCGATLRFDRVPALLERLNLQTLHAGPKE